MIVCKFGGSSLADAGQVVKVCDLIAGNPDRRIVVVSAPGKRNSDDAKITDLLIAGAEKRLAGESADAERREILSRFAAIQKDLGLPGELMEQIEADLDGRLDSDVGHRAQYLDRLKAAGEDNAARLVAAALRARGVAADYVSPLEAGLLLSDEYGNARILPESYDNLAALRKTRSVVVFPGFFGFTREGDIVTFSRGGSDITGSILAAAVRADLYENFTDVDSVLAADPRIVPQAAPIPELTYREMRELSYAGFGVLHDEAIIPAVRAGIPICVRNTNKPESPGTRITPERRLGPHGEVVGIASDRGFCTIYVSKYLMNREIGFGRRVLQVLEEEGLSYEHVPSGIDNMSVILKEESFDAETERRVLRRLRDELDVADVSVERGLALIMIVGEGMRYTVGLAAKATRALGEAGVNIEMINQGSSEISMMFGVKAVDRQKAILSLHHAFFGK